MFDLAPVCYVSLLLLWENLYFGSELAATRSNGCPGFDWLEQLFDVGLDQSGDPRLGWLTLGLPFFMISAA